MLINCELWFENGSKLSFPSIEIESGGGATAARLPKWSITADTIPSYARQCFGRYSLFYFSFLPSLNISHSLRPLRIELLLFPGGCHLLFPKLDRLPAINLVTPNPRAVPLPRLYSPPPMPSPSYFLPCLTLFSSFSYSPRMSCFRLGFLFLV